MKISIDIKDELVDLIDKLKVVYGARTRGRVVEMLLEDLLHGDEPEEPGDS